MRPSHAVALMLLLLSCAHTPPEPTLSGSLDGYHFDRTSLSGGPGTGVVELSPDGAWSGTWVVRSLAIGESDLVVGVEARLTGGLLQSTWGDVPVTFGPRYVSLHETSVDFVLRRSDGGPVPDALVVPLWLIMRTWSLMPSEPIGRCVDVEGIGTVQLFMLPRRSAPYHLTVENRCTFDFVDPVVAGKDMLELPPGAPGAASRPPEPRLAATDDPSSRGIAGGPLSR